MYKIIKIIRIESGAEICRGQIDLDTFNEAIKSPVDFYNEIWNVALAQGFISDQENNLYHVEILDDNKSDSSGRTSSQKSLIVKSENVLKNSDFSDKMYPHSASIIDFHSYKKGTRK